MATENKDQPSEQSGPNIDVESTDDSRVAIKDIIKDGSVEGDWSVSRCGANAFMLKSEHFERFSKGGDSSICYCSIDFFKVYLDALIDKRVTGAVSVDSPQGVKVIYFKQGKIVFASSTNIDDRLGEICYRSDLISLDSFMESTVQVTADLKFGQVLLKDKILSNIGLSKALKLQTSEVVRSLFLFERLGFEFQLDVKPVTEVMFLRGDKRFLADAASYGVVFRNFKRRFTPDTQVKLSQNIDFENRFPPSTFLGDLIQLIQQESDIEQLLKNSRLNDTYTLNTLMYLYNRNLIYFDPFKESEPTSSNKSSGYLSAKIDVYEMLIRQVLQKFKEEEKIFPKSELQKYAELLDGGEKLYTFQFSNDCLFSKECINNIIDQENTIYGRSQYIYDRIEAMCKFIIQVAGDNLSRGNYSEIKTLYLDIS